MRITIIVIVVMIMMVIIGMPLVTLAAGILMKPSDPGTIFSSEDTTLERGTVEHKGLLTLPITLQIDGTSNEFNYYLSVREGKNTDNWWKRLNVRIFTVLVKKDEYAKIREGDEITFYEKPECWPFLMKRP